MKTKRKEKEKKKKKRKEKKRREKDMFIVEFGTCDTPGQSFTTRPRGTHR